jgi:hypothetical protein
MRDAPTDTFFEVTRRSYLTRSCDSRADTGQAAAVLADRDDLWDSSDVRYRSVGHLIWNAGGSNVCAAGCDRAQRTLHERGLGVLLVFHDVDDVDHWLASPKREELSGPMSMTARTFRDTQGSNRVGLIVEVPDISVWERALERAPRRPT